MAGLTDGKPIGLQAELLKPGNFGAWAANASSGPRCTAPGFVTRGGKEGNSQVNGTQVGARHAEDRKWATRRFGAKWTGMKLPASRGGLTLTVVALALTVGFLG